MRDVNDSLVWNDTVVEEMPHLRLQKWGVMYEMNHGYRRCPGM